MHEDHAIQQYKEKAGNDVEKAGLCLFPCGYLGSTPDGIINSTNVPDKGVLEVNCPWKYRNNTINEMVQAELGAKDSTFYLKNNITLRGSTKEKIFFSCSSPYELSFWRDVEVVSRMSKHVFVS